MITSSNIVQSALHVLSSEVRQLTTRDRAFSSPVECPSSCGLPGTMLRSLRG